MNKRMKFLRSILFTILIMLFTTIGLVTLMHVNGIDLSIQTNENNNDGILYTDFWNREHGEMPTVVLSEGDAEPPPDLYEISSSDIVDEPSMSSYEEDPEDSSSEAVSDPSSDMLDVSTEDDLPVVADDPDERLQEIAVSIRNSLAALSDDPPPDKFTVTVRENGESGAEDSEEYDQDDPVEINAGIRAGYIFDGWTVESGGITLSDPSNTTITFNMPSNNVTITANWLPASVPPEMYTVTVVGGGAGSTATPVNHEVGTTVPINAGTRAGYTFSNWTITPYSVTLANQNSATTTFPMPNEHVVVTANWTSLGDPAPVRWVTVYQYPDAIASLMHQAFYTGNTVNLDAGTRNGFTFSHWEFVFPFLTGDIPHVEIVNMYSPVTSFTVPSRDVTVLGHWTVYVPPPPQTPPQQQTPPPQGDNDQSGTNQSVTDQGGIDLGVTNQGGTTQGSTNQGSTNQRQSNNNQGARNPALSPSQTPQPDQVQDGVIPDSTITEALESDRPLIQIGEGDSTVISAEALQDIKESGKMLRVELQNGLIISINPDSITENATSLDLNIDVTITERATIVNDIQFPPNSIIIAPSAHGEFGFTISFDISAEQLAEAGLNANDVRLFHISTDGVVTEAGTVRQNADGSVTLSISHASVYHLAEEAPTIAASIEETPVNEAPVAETPVVEAPDVEVPASETTNNQRLSQPVIPPIQTENSVDTYIWIIIIALTVVLLGGAGFIILRAKRRAKSGIEPNAEAVAQEV